MWRYILFDLDGTLTDSGEGIMKSVQYALLRAFDITVEDYTELRAFVGPPLHDQFMRWTGCTREEADEAVRLYRERYVPVGLYENRLYDGIPELLERLKAEGFRMAVASSKPTALCERILQHFGVAGYFDVILGSEPDGRRSNKAEVVEDVLKALHAEDKRDECILVGDTKYDMAGAKAAGLAAMGVSFGYGLREELEAEWPDCIVDSPREAGNVIIGVARAEGWTGRGPAGGSGSGPLYTHPKTGAVRDARKTGRCVPSDGRVIFRIWRIVYPLLTDLFVSNGIVLGCMLAVYLLGFMPQEIMNNLGTELTGVADAVLLAIFAVLYAEDEKQRRQRGTPWRLYEKKPFGVPHGLMVALYTIAASEVIGILISIVPFKDARYEALEAMFSSPPLIIQILVVGIIGPVMEELLFRGILFRRLRDYTGFYVGAVLSAAAFGIAHGNITQGIYALILGILLAALYEHFGTLKACICAHIANNMFSIAAEGLFDKIGPYGAAVTAVLSIGLAVFFTILIFWEKERVNVV